ncbi:MAG: hypothetical protein ACI4R5_05585, partial [Acetatifactor sp.]
MKLKENLNENIKKWFRRDNLIVLVLTGVLLFIIALPTKESEKKEAGESGMTLTDTAGGQEGYGKGSFDVQTKEASDFWKSGGQQEYIAYLEEKLKATLSDMAGVGRVEVMITLKASEELIVEKDEPVSRSNTNEEDAEGGRRIITQLQSEESTVYRTAGSDSEPYVIKTLLPTVEGVVVVAEGAGSGSVNRNITEIIQALFGVEAHKVRVVKMEGGR